MKILIASDLHWPTINGVATTSRNLAIGMSARGHEVVVIAPSQTGRAHKEKDTNHTIERTASLPFPFYQNFRISVRPDREVKRIIENFKPDVIQVQMPLGIGLASLKIGNKMGIPVVTATHAMPENLLNNLKLLAPFAKPISYMLEAYGARFHSKADYIILPTQSAIDMFNASDKVSVPMSVVSNGIDLSRFKPGHAHRQIYEKFNIPKDKQIVSYIGRVDAEKHLLVLIEAFRILRETGNDAHLLIVGDGTDRLNLELLADKHRLADYTTFTGRVSDEDLVDLHKIATVYVMPSPVELQSIATLEALASGRPVVVVDAGAVKELCHDGQNGLLVRKDDYDQMAKAIKKILDDSELIDRFSHHSLEIAKTHDITTTFETIESIYGSLIHQ